MENKVFLDTGGLIALIMTAEENHLLAVRVFEKLDKFGYKLFTTEYVLAELVNWLRCRKNFEVTRIFQFLHNLYIKDLDVIEVGRDRFSNALILMHKFKDHFFSMTDCVSFVVMNEFKIKNAFTTDKHFVVAGFNNLLDRDLSVSF